MKAISLIEKLSQYPSEMEVVLNSDGDYVRVSNVDIQDIPTHTPSGEIEPEQMFKETPKSSGDYPDGVEDVDFILIT
jgi:hypothetical protein